MNCFSEEQLARISHLIREIEKLSDVEKLFLYLQLPCGRAETSDITEGGRSKFNGAKSNFDLFAKKPDQETTQTYTWILSHLEVDPNVSLPKQEVYDEYRAFCQANKFEPLCVADFGKAMKHAFPCIKPRRLGQRGNSRYCYSGLRKKYKIQPPDLPDMIEPTFCLDNDCSQAYNQIIRDCRDNPNECPLNKPNFTVNEVMNLKIEHGSSHQYPVNGSNTNGISNNSNNNNGFSTASSSSFNNIDSSIKLSAGGPPVQHHQQGPGDAGLVKQMRATPQQPVHCIAGSNQPLLAPGSSSSSSSCHEYTPSNPIPIGQSSSAASMRCSYGGIIQPPGTPDDDDYQHNYQDISSFNRHLFPSVSAPPPPSHHHHQQQHHHHNHHHQQQQPATSGFAQLQPHHSLKADSQDQGARLMAESNEAHLSDLNPNHLAVSQPPFSTDLIGNQAPPATSTTQSMTGGFPQMQFSHMNSSFIDSCASPFQSPASTPYPQMGNYMTQDIQDYYPTSIVYK